MINAPAQVLERSCTSLGKKRSKNNKKVFNVPVKVLGF